MEVHHPHHVTLKKKWTEYFLEFFMLFPAVFSGLLLKLQESIRLKRKKGNISVNDQRSSHLILRNLKISSIAEVHKFFK